MPRKAKARSIFSWTLPLNTIHENTGIPLSILQAGVYQKVPAELPAFKVGRQVLVTAPDFLEWLTHFPRATLHDWRTP